MAIVSLTQLLKLVSQTVLREYPRQAVDANGDGFVDIVGFGRDNVYVSLGTSSKDDVLVGTASDDTIDGLTGNDILWGSEGNDSLIGGTGSDTLTGGAGSDTLTGGTGSDRFRLNTGTAFNSRTNGIDRITDFTTLDKIVLDKNTFRSLSSSPGNGFSVASEFAVVNNPAAVATQSAKIVYVSTTGALIYNQNSSAAGFGAGGQFAVLNGNPTLTANDFQITPSSSSIFD